jgi:hypothetical protein
VKATGPLAPPGGSRYHEWGRQSRVGHPAGTSLSPSLAVPLANGAGMAEVESIMACPPPSAGILDTFRLRIDYVEEEIREWRLDRKRPELTDRERQDRYFEPAFSLALNYVRENLPPSSITRGPARIIASQFLHWIARRIAPDEDLAQIPDPGPGISTTFLFINGVPQPPDEPFWRRACARCGYLEDATWDHDPLLFRGGWLAKRLIAEGGWSWRPISSPIRYCYCRAPVPLPQGCAPGMKGCCRENWSMASFS